MGCLCVLMAVIVHRGSGKTGAEELGEGQVRAACLGAFKASGIPEGGELRQSRYAEHLTKP